MAAVRDLFEGDITYTPLHPRKGTHAEQGSQCTNVQFGEPKCVILEVTRVWVRDSL